jgi:hypothetical protein
MVTVKLSWLTQHGNDIVLPDSSVWRTISDYFGKFAVLARICHVINDKPSRKRLARKSKKSTKAIPLRTTLKLFNPVVRYVHTVLGNFNKFFFFCSFLSRKERISWTFIDWFCGSLFHNPSTVFCAYLLNTFVFFCLQARWLLFRQAWIAVVAIITVHFIKNPIYVFFVLLSSIIFQKTFRFKRDKIATVS